MRILLTANASYLPPRGGATRSNLVWIEHLAAAGHACRIVATSLADTQEKREQIAREQMQLDWVPVSAAPGVEAFRRGLIEIHSVVERARQIAVLREQIRDFQPDWVLVSSEDVGHVLLRAAFRLAPERIVYLAHTPQFFPFGPASWNPDSEAAALVAKAAAVVAIGTHTAGYIRQHTGRDAAVIHPPIYGSGPFEDYSSFEGGLITLINPCAVKGISIFLALADALPHYEFGALPGWGTTSGDRRELEKRANVTLLPNTKHIAEVMARTRLLLMPSLWYEGFGLSVMEAMLHGIPVVSSDAGGLVEAKMGTGFVIPVRAIERYEAVFDERSMPKPVVPPAEIGPWRDAVRLLLSDREAYERESAASREAALRFVGGLRADKLEHLLESLKPRRAAHSMRILMAQNSLYYPSHGGGDKSNRLLMEALAARGHQCRVIARISKFGPQEHEEFLQQLAARAVQVTSASGGVVIFERNGVEVHVATDHPHLRAYFADQIAEFQPTVILTSTDDPAQVLLDAALRAEPSRVVYLARATLAVPFGPDCAFPSESKTALLRNVNGVVGVSQYVADYVRKWSGIEAVHVPISLLEPGPFPELGRFDNEYVTLVNPCAVKGISIFLALAERMPEVRFAAVPTWGTSREDREALAAHPNIDELAPVDDIDRLLARTRVLLVPSLWAEARSRIVLEAMLRGVPVIASNVGGIPEAKMGVEYLLPVKPIEKYDARLNERMVPVAEVPPQDIGPWYRALARLTSDRAHYEEISRQSREAALRYAANLSVRPFEEFLEKVVAAPRRARTEPHAVERLAGEKLSPEKRKLLALRLRKIHSSRWFPAAEAAGQAGLRLFCFPHAGGGASAFARWAAQLPAGVAVVPAHLPGRESRAAETPLASMAALVDALAEAIQPYLGRPFTFFGHSMGAVVAFELAEHLQKRKQATPKALFVSGARAPRFRLDWTPPPEPTEEQLLEDLRRLEGVPAEALQNEELLRLVLPALRADTALYRKYVYVEEPPLGCPIRVYGGKADPNVKPEHLEAWSAHTACTSAVRLFSGGHFFLQTTQKEFLEKLSADLRDLLP